MNCKKILGVVLVLVGFALLGMSYYIKNQVEDGKGKVSSAQEKVDAGNKVLSVNPTTKQVGKVATAPIQKKIDKGNRDIAHYEKLAYQLQMVGIVLILLGLGVFIFYRKR